MGRDLQFKLLTLVFAFVALFAISACAVASSPSSTSDPGGSTTSESPEAPDEPETAPTATPEPDPEPTPASDDADDQASDDSTADDTDRTSDDDADVVDETDGTTAREDEAEPEEETPGNPVQLLIDSIDVDAAFEYVGIDEDGNMDVPQEWDNVAWYEPGAVPGDRGNAVIAGHYDSYTDPAVFYDLNELEEGDEVRIITEHDEELVFEVTEIELVHVDDADTGRIFGETDDRNLNLITCEGAWDSDAGMYDQRLIVYTTLTSD